MIKACIFDLDGVLVETAHYHFYAWRRLANSLGFDFTEQQNEGLKGVSRKESLELILQWGGIDGLTDEKKTELTDLKNGWYLEYIRKMTPAEVLPGVFEFLDKLKQAGIKIGLGSASQNSRLILESTNLLPYFDIIIDGTSTSKSKPDPEVFLLGAKGLGLEPADCIVFEDAEKGVEAALAGGFQCVGVGAQDVLFRAHRVIPGFVGFDL